MAEREVKQTDHLPNRQKRPAFVNFFIIIYKHYTSLTHKVCKCGAEKLHKRIIYDVSLTSITYKTFRIRQIISEKFRKMEF